MCRSVAAKREKPFDPGSDPTKLAWLGMMVRNRLGTIPGVERIGVDGADLFVAPGFLHPSDCREIIRVINSKAVPSRIYRGKDSEGFRTSSTHYFKRDDPLTRSVELHISSLLGIDDNYSETMQGQRYQVGQEFRHHHDFFHIGEGYWKQVGPEGGQRTWTAMINLNEPREGGETDFPHLKVQIRPKVGTLVLWNNMDANGHPNRKTLHAGLPVKRGIKHIITKWYRQEPWRLLNSDTGSDS